MVQGALKLNNQKPQKGGRRHSTPKVSKVDILKKKKKSQTSGAGPLSAAATMQRRFEVRAEANLAAQAHVEGNAPLGVVKVTPQQLAKAKQNLGGAKQKEKVGNGAKK
mmetsp:Transcript_79361/g.137627  ORF Transcript_79361/g.137627 Transcript_79361/m.137627 type:complete len:108 (+) Transcript_79361:70-393(+)